GDVPTVIAHIKAGRIKPLAATSKLRSDIFPDVPTFVEQGFADTVADQWAGVLAPAKTPPEVIARLNAAIVAVMNEPEMRAWLASMIARLLVKWPLALRSGSMRWSSGVLQALWMMSIEVAGSERVSIAQISSSRLETSMSSSTTMT